MAIYGTELDADTYLADKPTWLALTSAEKQVFLERAARWLDMQRWRGNATDAYQDLTWPRSGMYNRNGGSLDPSIIPDDILSASYELAYLDHDGKSLFADSVTIDYASSSGAAGGLTRNTVTAGKSGGVEVTKEYATSTSSTTVSTDRVDYQFPFISALIDHYLIDGGGNNRLIRY